MYIYCPLDRWYLNGQVPSRDDPHVFTQIKSLLFAPEVDLTLATLPINGFTAEILADYDGQPWERAFLFDDMDNLWAAYVICRVERIDKQTIRIVAQSELMQLDLWETPAVMYQGIGVKVRDILDDLSHRASKMMELWPDIELDPYYNDFRVIGFCPKQTARQRLQEICISIGAIVQQSFHERLVVAPAPDVDTHAYYARGTLIPVGDTYIKPTINFKNPVKNLEIEVFTDFTTDEPIDSEYAWQSDKDGDGVTWYYRNSTWTFENDDPMAGVGTTVSIPNIRTFISQAQSATQEKIIEWLAAAYFRKAEINLDCINNGQYHPGQKVRVYTSEDTIYTGYIQSCDFQFGLQAKSRLVIGTKLERLPTGTLKTNYRYGNITLASNRYIYPTDEPYHIKLPTITRYIPTHDGTMVQSFEPEIPTISGTTPDGKTEIEAQYRQILPDHIEIITPPDRITYLNGQDIDYTGLIVRVYDADNRPWTQGGLFVDGVIPICYLTLPEQRANLQRADRSGRQSDLNILPSIAPVSVDTYSSMTFDESHWYSTMLVKWEYLIEGGLMTANVRLNPDGTARYFFRYIFASESPNVRFEERITRANGQVYADRFYTIGTDKSYTHAGKKVYYKAVFSSNAYGDNHYVGPVTDYTDEMTSASPVGPTAWTMIYGDVVSGVQKIPVQWKVPGTGQTFEDTFEILISANPAIPREIKYEHEPNQLIYTEGDRIDYTGMVFRVYSETGDPWTLDDEYIDGIIPLSKLELISNAPPQSEILPLLRYSDEGLRVYSGRKYVYALTNFTCRLRSMADHYYRVNVSGNNCYVGVCWTNSYVYYVPIHAASNTSGASVTVVFSDDDTGEILDEQTWQLSDTYTHNGKTVYYKIVNYVTKLNGTSNALYNDSTTPSVARIFIESIYTDYNDRQICWTMVYGYTVSTLPVKWKYAPTGQTFTGSINIGVWPR